MFRKTSLLYLFLILFVIAGCKEDEPTPEAVKPTEQPVSTPEDSQDVESDEPDFPIQETGVFISELLPGVPGGNNREFIELYNAGDIPVDLQGWSLWYSLGSGQEESELITWDEPTLIPSNGHILLVRSNNDFGIIPDGVFDVSLFERKGGVALRDSQGASVDLVGWGDAAEGFYAGTPAAVPEDGASLERLPGGVDGNGVSSGDNSADFFAQTAPDPQNSGSSPTPGQTNQLSIHLEAPISVQPGEEFVYLVRVENHSGQDASGVIASIPVPPGYGVIELPDGAREVDSRIEWPVGDLPDGESTIGNILLRSPFTYSDALVRGYYVEADAVPAVFGPLRYVSVAGGSIPVVNARELVGNIVTVEGTATMYTGGFFAGTTGTKFYMEDETGGIQVYVPGGAGLVDVSIGDRVRVTGEIEPYRDSLELVPGDIPADIEILEPGAAEPAPSPITVADNERNDAVIGMLNVIEGTVTQIEELTYDYQLQLMDESGESTLVLIEKQTGVTAEPLDVGQQYKITGISEYYSGAKQIKPRLQSDLEQVFPPVLMLELKAANSVLPGEVLTYTITATNHKPEELTDVHIVANLPELEREFLYLLLDGGYELDEELVWIIDKLEPNGGSAEVRFTLQLGDEEALENETIVAKSAIATASGQMTEWVESDGYLTFIAGGVPIWAIQGSGDRSPYARTEATTEGIVTGVFPDLGGFWIQEIVNDYDPTTS
ncbi:MAG: lamin tail domain-containing protein, partial [Candidatus Promineifilaceae bacterium]